MCCLSTSDNLEFKYIQISLRCQCLEILLKCSASLSSYLKPLGIAIVSKLKMCCEYRVKVTINKCMVRCLFTSKASLWEPFDLEFSEILWWLVEIVLRRKSCDASCTLGAGWGGYVWGVWLHLQEGECLHGFTRRCAWSKGSFCGSVSLDVFVCVLSKHTALGPNSSPSHTTLFQTI